MPAASTQRSLAQPRHAVLVAFLDRDRLRIGLPGLGTLRQRHDHVATTECQRIAIAALRLRRVVLPGECITERFPGGRAGRKRTLQVWLVAAYANLTPL